MAENIALNFDEGAAPYAFMNEPTCTGHRGNVFNRINIEVGVGYLVCDNPSAGTTHEYHISVQGFRGDWNIEPSVYCGRNAATSCQVPSDLPSIASCDSNTDQWDFVLHRIHQCSLNVDAELTIHSACRR